MWQLYDEAQRPVADSAGGEQPGNGSLSPVEDPEELKKRVPYPKAVFFIVCNEFCERFTFYGMRTVLSLYLKNQLNFSDTTSTVIYHVFIMICYFFPLLGAIVADSWLGKYKTILYLSMVYALGNVVVSVSAVPLSGMPAVALTMIGLVLIALGTGGIKPCVAAFGGDQFVVPQQEDHLKKFFSIFYFTINAGSFVSTLLTPILREVPCFGEDDCYPLAFGVPAVLMILAIVIYFCGKVFYKVKQPEGNVVVKVGQCIWYALTKGKKTGGHWLDRAQERYEKGFIEDIKATLRVLTLYIPLPFFWALFDQQGSRWTFQATRMNGNIGSFKIQPDQMQVVNPILILVLIPLFETVLYPTFAKCNLLKRPLQRLTVGGLLAAIAFSISAVVELALEPTYPVLPENNLAQIRLFNALPHNITVQFNDLEMEPQIIPNLDFWKHYEISAQGEKVLTMKYTVNGVAKEKSIAVVEKNMTSYIFMPDYLVKISNDETDKSKKAYPKLRLIYSGPAESKKFTVSSSNFETTFTLPKDMPYSNMVEYKSCDTYTLKSDNDVIDTFKLEQGGVYTLLISEYDGKLHSKLLTVIQPNSVHILWLLPQYIIITTGEIMFSITGLEFSFTQAPVSMKALLQAAWLLTVAVGNLIVVIISEAKLFDRQFYEFLLFAGLMALDMCIFALMAMRYKYVEAPQTEEAETEEKSKG